MKKINIDIPDGHEIDVEASDLAKGEIIFKPVQKRWEDFGWCDCWILDVKNGKPVTKCEELNVGGSYEWDYPTEELLLAAEAQRELLFWRNRVWKEDGDWKPDWSNDAFNKVVISPSLNGMTAKYSATISRPLAFRTYQIANQFLKDHKDLIEQAKPLL